MTTTGPATAGYADPAVALRGRFFDVEETAGLGID